MRETIDEHVNQTLSSLGRGRSQMDSCAYETAWVARLSRDYSCYGFESALSWLRNSQYPDGSWCGEVLHYHDRMISTLSAIAALRVVGNGHDDDNRIRHGEDFL